MASKAFGDVSSKLLRLLAEKQKALDEKIIILEEKDEELTAATTSTASTLSSASSQYVQFSISEDVTSQIGSAGNYINTSHQFYPRSVKVFYNGIKQVEEEHFWINSTSKVKLFFTPIAGSFLEIVYTPLSMGSLTSTAIKFMPPQ